MSASRFSSRSTMRMRFQCRFVDLSIRRFVDSARDAAARRSRKLSRPIARTSPRCSNATTPISTLRWRLQSPAPSRTRGRCARPPRAFSCTTACTRLHGRVRDGRARARGCAAGCGERRDGAADLGRAPRARRVNAAARHRQRCAGRVHRPRGRRARRRLLHGAGRDRGTGRRQRAVGRRSVRPGCVREVVPHRRRGDRAGERHALRARRDRRDARRGAGEAVSGVRPRGSCGSMRRSSFIRRCAGAGSV